MCTALMRMDVKPHFTSAALSIPRKQDYKIRHLRSAKRKSKLILVYRLCLYSRVLSRTLLSGQFEDRGKLAIPHKMTGS